jgi:hypothetical protein
MRADAGVSREQQRLATIRRLRRLRRLDLETTTAADGGFGRMRSGIRLKTSGAPAESRKSRILRLAA